LFVFVLCLMPNVCLCVWIVIFGYIKDLLSNSKLWCLQLIEVFMLHILQLILQTKEKAKYTYVVVFLISKIRGERYLFVFLILKQLLYVAIKILIHKEASTDRKLLTDVISYTLPHPGLPRHVRHWCMVDVLFYSTHIYSYA
jgi:hypothetical protein